MALQDLCKQYGIHFKKQLGQNLLLDDNINRIMVDAAELTREDDVVEVGAGLGALTQRLHPLAGRVLSIEIDMAFMPCLEDQFGAIENLRLFRGDILNHSLAKLLDEYLPGGARYKMVSNVPYYITTPILFHFWESGVPFERLVIMVQDEVGKRLQAAVNAPDYGALALAARLYSDVDIVHFVPRTCFRPIPKVDSCIVRLRRRTEPIGADVAPRFVMKVVRAAFGQRRKTLRNSLTRSGAFGAPQEAVLDAMAAEGIDPQRRPQTLGLEEFVRLAAAIKARIGVETGAE
ncbi:MAG TPA: 16S rRNA (adenine(1518)-N(6)/adenine(1519)-N(6))-dimethyltransferase RsmA [Candidatus Hydrogenedentes bacterium]|nr:16S rRNA (adenine(1518)-N(6)/adenine(1519)-N(6))-dimethyltransferase RsmA [Candidatus Hydrogenedentota bacterium]HOS01715.1 16S rRNA (adenine(1518)-N(6)/adenine(1519)-N(6))-dimethyltransferase RsmA [Candidatus Hydrogenedentota bacterium]